MKGILRVMAAVAAAVGLCTSCAQVPTAAAAAAGGGNPLGKGTPEEFQRALGPSSTRVLALKPGEKASF